MKALHIDGRPTAWFERKCNGAVERISYFTFAWLGDDPAELVRHAYETVAKIEEMSYMNGDDEAPVIFWRRRMECDLREIQVQEPNSKWRVSFRLAAVPALTDEQWASLDPKPQGAAVKELNCAVDEKEEA